MRGYREKRPGTMLRDGKGDVKSGEVFRARLNPARPAVRK